MRPRRSAFHGLAVGIPISLLLWILIVPVVAWAMRLG